jgi:hypothetical protein
MSLIPVKPAVIDGIEFYVSPNGEETGMSISGLAELCGVPHSTLHQRLLYKLSQEKTTWKAPKCLERFQGRVYSKVLIGDNPGNPARIVVDDVCAAVIEYYAFDSKAANDTALYSFRKFASKGIRSWIKEVTGYAQEGDNGQVLDLVQQVLTKVEKLQTTVEEYNNIRKTTVNVFPNLDEMLNSLTENKALPSGEMTLNDWLESKGIELSKSAKHRLANIVADTYKSTTGRRPPKRPIGTNKVCVYKTEELPILEMSFKYLLSQ